MWAIEGYDKKFLVRVDGPKTLWTDDPSKARPFTRKSSLSNFLNKHNIPGGKPYKLIVGRTFADELKSLLDQGHDSAIDMISEIAKNTGIRKSLLYRYSDSYDDLQDIKRTASILERLGFEIITHNDPSVFTEFRDADRFEINPFVRFPIYEIRIPDEHYNVTSRGVNNTKN